MAEAERKARGAPFDPRRLIHVVACCLVALCLFGPVGASGRPGIHTETSVADVEPAPAWRMAQNDSYVSPPVGYGRINPEPPQVSRVRVMSGDTVVYDTQGSLRNKVEASGGAYDLKVSIWFSSSMASSKTTVTAGFEAPYDTYQLETKEGQLETTEASGAIWDTWIAPHEPPGQRSVLETSITVPKVEARSGLLLWFSISGVSAIGLNLDSNRIAPGAQPDTKHFVVLGLDESYIATLTMEWSMEGSYKPPENDGTDITEYRQTYRPFEVQLGLFPSDPFYKNLVLEVDLWRQQVAAVENGVRLERRMQGELRARYESLTQMLASVPPEHRPAELTAQASAMLAQVDLLDKGIADTETVLDVIAGAEDDFLRLIAFRSSYSEYTCNKERTRPIPARFGGMDGERRRVRTTGALRYETYDHHEAPGWDSDDLTQLGWSYIGTDGSITGCPRLESITIDTVEFQQLSVLVADLPVLAPDPAATDSGGSLWALERLTEMIRYSATEATVIAWRFASSDEGVIKSRTGSERKSEFQNGRLRMPSLPAGQLLRVQYHPSGSWPIPVDGTGRRFAERTGEAPYREEETYAFTNRQENGRLSTWYVSGIGGRPRYTDADGLDAPWMIESESVGDQTTSFTHGSHRAHGIGFVITGRTHNGSLSGGMSRESAAETSNIYENQYHHSRIGWRFEHNGLRGLPPSIAVRKPEPGGDYQSPPFLAFEAASYPREPIPGLPITMAFRVENASRLPAAQVSVDITLADPRNEYAPKKLETATDLCAPLDSGRFRCDLGDMDSGEIGDLVFTAETPMTGAVIWTADLDSTGDLGGAVELGGMLGARGPPRIMDVVVIHDQTAIKHELPLYAYPYGPNAQGGDTRYLLVVGHNLPQRPAQNLTLKDEEAIHYGFLAFPDSNSQFYQEWFDKGWKRFYDMEDASVARARAEEDGYDAVLVRADLKPGILPGQHTVVLSGAEGHWGLEFGDLSARLSFIRRLDGDGIDLLRNAYLPERIYLAVETNIALPLEEIPVFVNAEDLGANQRGEIELVARRSELGNGRIYLTGPLDLHQQGRAPSLSGGTAIAAVIDRNDPSLLQARIDESFILKSLHLPLSPVVASVAVGVTPAAGDYSWLWRDALSRVAACHDDIVVEDWGRLTQAESDEFWNLIILTTSDHFPGQSVTFGHHAAAVLLRDMFVFVMDKQIRKLEWIRNNQRALRGLLAYMKPRAWDDTLPLLRIPAKDFGGLEIEYRYIILNDTAWLAEENGMSEEAIEAWQDRETKAALGKLIEAAKAAAQQAREAGDCETEDLIRLTGFSFASISHLLKAEFVTLAEATSSGGGRALLWQPDMAARFWVDQVAPLAEAVRQQQFRSNVDTDVTLAAVAFVTLPFMLAEGTAVALVAFAIDLVDLAVTTVHELSQYFASEAELAFASGAAITIGDQRHERALENAKGWASTAFGIGTSAFGAVMGGVDALPKLAMLRRVARGRQLARTMEGAGDLASLRLVDLQDFGAFAMSSWMRGQNAGLESLTSIERRALAMVEEFKTSNKATKILPEPDLPPVNVVDSFVPKAPVRFDPDAQSGLGTARPPPGGRIETPRSSGEVPNAFESRVPPDNAAVRFTDDTGTPTDLPLGERLGRGYTSEVFAHADDPDNLAIRITYLRENAPAAALDQFGDTALRTRVNSVHVRPVRIESSFEVAGAEFQGQAITRVSVVERVPETAQQTIARQGGRMSVAQMMAYEGALRDLNKQGLVWLDNKSDNFAFIPAADGSGRVQVVVIDPGGIVAIRAGAGAATGESVGELARRVQLRVNGDFATQIPDFARIKTPKYRTHLRRETLMNDFGEAFNYREMGITGPDQLLFNARSGEDFEYIAPLFAVAE